MLTPTSLSGEDQLGDMAFKVAGTEKGSPSLQMEIKVQGIRPDIMEKARPADCGISPSASQPFSRGTRDPRIHPPCNPLPVHPSAVQRTNRAHY